MHKGKENVSMPLFGLPRLLPLLKPYRNRMIRMITLGLACSVIDVCYPLFNRYVLDHFVAEGSMEGLPAFILLYLAVLVLQSLINNKSMIDAGIVEMYVDRDLRNSAFAHLQTLSFSYFNRNSVGYIHARVMSDTAKIGEAVSWRMMDCIWNGSYILFAIAVMLYTRPELAAWMIALLALSTVVISFFQKKLIVIDRRIREINSRITGNFNEGIAGARSVKILGIERVMQKEFESETEKMRSESVRAVRHSISAFIGIQANIERFTDLLAHPSDVADTPEVIARYGDDVTFRYPDGEENVLEHFSLKVPYGQNIAIVGETGAGKSTLVNLVCRFYEPTEGAILIDGRDARERSQLWLHRNLGYVLQTPYLFSGSVRENLRYGKPEATDEQIMEALRMVCAQEVVERMGGLDSDVGEGGSSLSTGEKQLLSFARALLADPRLLILDEATSSIDSRTEKVIQNAISVVTKNRTSFVIAHRLSTIVSADLILVVRDGKITERGTHRELIEKKGYYYSLYKMQHEKEIPVL